MSKWKLDANQWYLIRCLFIAKYENDASYLVKYVNECIESGIARDILIKLKDKKILDKDYKIPEKGENFTLKTLAFNESFIKQYYKTSLEAGQELFDAYPPYLTLDDGRLLPARNLVSKVVFKSLEDFFLFYSKSIKFDLELHNKILKSLEFAKQNNLIRSAIVEYCVSQKWTEHIQSMESDDIGKFTNRYDISEVI